MKINVCNLLCDTYHLKAGIQIMFTTRDSKSIRIYVVKVFLLPFG